MSDTAKCCFWDLLLLLLSFNQGQSPKCFKNSRNTKMVEMTINPVDPWKNRRAGELR